MKLNHLALAVQDQQRSIEFYAMYFGFDPSRPHVSRRHVVEVAWEP